MIETYFNNNINNAKECGDPFPKVQALGKEVTNLDV
jgi:hypothetical protein